MDAEQMKQHAQLVQWLRNYYRHGPESKRHMLNVFTEWIGEERLELDRVQIEQILAANITGDIAPPAEAEQAGEIRGFRAGDCGECIKCTQSSATLVNGVCAWCDGETPGEPTPTPPQADAAQGDAGELVIPEQRCEWTDGALENGYCSLFSISSGAPKHLITVRLNRRMYSENVWEVSGLSGFNHFESPDIDLAKRHAERQVGAEWRESHGSCQCKECR